MNIIIHDLDKIIDDNFVIIDSDDINYCKGCFTCWTKTPMECAFNDKCKKTSKYFLNAEKIVIISKCIYGSFSSKVKKILEKNIGYVMPYFTIREKEIHHKMRNNNKPDVIVIFYGEIDNNEKYISRELIKRNKLNFNYNSTKIFYLKNEDEVRSKLNDIIY